VKDVALHQGECLYDLVWGGVRFYLQVWKPRVMMNSRDMAFWFSFLLRNWEKLGGDIMVSLWIIVVVVVKGMRPGVSIVGRGY
jgi:hypothetical protein